MAQLQEEGWPLGLQLNMRGGMGRNRDLLGSISFSTLLTGSTSSCTTYSSDFDSESTGSFFRDRSMTLGSLMGVSSILELSRRSGRCRTRPESMSLRSRRCSNRSRNWFLSLCNKTRNSGNNVPSLGQFLEVERRASSDSKTALIRWF
ncbi:hypothetical protein ACHQM5_021376 [Ranunculus cassubicifolius]